MVYVVDSISYGLFKIFGWTVFFWIDYFKLVVVLSILLHVVMFRMELTKHYPRIPYEQDFP